MTEDLAQPSVDRGTRTGFHPGAWVWANAVGLAVAYGLFGLFGSMADVLGAQHGTVHGIAAVVGGGGGALPPPLFEPPPPE